MHLAKQGETKKSLKILFFSSLIKIVTVRNRHKSGIREYHQKIYETFKSRILVVYQNLWEDHYSISSACLKVLDTSKVYK